MYPYDIIPGLDLYGILLCVGILAAMITFRVCADRLDLGARVQNFTLLVAGASVVVGYFFAILFQAFYNIGKYGEFRIDAQTGATFYGGLIGGAAAFLLIYFGIGYFYFRKDRAHVFAFWHVTDIAAAAIAVAHGLGRIGCLMAGCCHGKQTDAWYGILMVKKQITVIPTQLFEAIFLFALCAFFLYRIWHKKSYNLFLYMIVYGVWRFLIEYARDDYRGTTVVSFLTPSQFTAVLMVVGGIALLVGVVLLRKRGEKIHENET